MAEAAAWARRPLAALLNELNGASTPNDDLFVPSRPPCYSPVSRAYKRALIRIHPDKHMADPLQHLAATEKFKALNDAFNKFKKAMNRD